MYIGPAVHYQFLQCSAIVPCWLGDNKGIQLVKKISHQQSPKVLLRETFWGPRLTWSDLWKMSQN